jgi:hypothetical protein
MSARERLDTLRLKVAPVTPAGAAVLLSLIFALYLAPSKQSTADLLAAVLLVIVLTLLGLRRSGALSGIKPLVPLLGMALYVVLLDLYGGGAHSASRYIREMLAGFIPFFLLFVCFRNLAPTQVPMLSVAVFLIPGLAHLLLMYMDILLAILRGDIPFSQSSRHGLLEYVKDVPRVGRRYASLALMHLLCAGLLLRGSFRSLPAKYAALGFFCLGILSLALLDARATYVSVVIGLALLIMAIGPGHVWRTLRRFQFAKLLLPACLLLVAAEVGYSAGKSRWVTLHESVAAAVHDVLYSNVALAQRPYVAEDYWNAPIEDVSKCYSERLFRCRIDQSAYLRTAWLLSGVQSMVTHPFGIGYSDDYMARLWGVAGNKGNYQRSDSFLVEHLVSFGAPGIMFYALLVMGVMRSLRVMLHSGRAWFALVGVCGIILVCVARALVDVFNEGLWRYLMALLGMYYGLLHSNEWRTRS